MSHFVCPSHRTGSIEQFIDIQGPQCLLAVRLAGDHYHGHVLDLRGGGQCADDFERLDVSDLYQCDSIPSVSLSHLSVVRWRGLCRCLDLLLDLND
jgi:hypothetical protein